MAVVQCTLNSWKYCAMPKFPTSPKPSSMIKIRINRKRKYESIVLGRRRCSQQRGMPWRARGESWLYLWLQHYRSTSKEMHWQPSRNMWADLCQGYLSNITQGSCIGLQRKKLFLSVAIKLLSICPITALQTSSQVVVSSTWRLFPDMLSFLTRCTLQQTTRILIYKLHRNYFLFKSFGKNLKKGNRMMLWTLLLWIAIFRSSQGYHGNILRKKMTWKAVLPE